MNAVSSIIEQNNEILEQRHLNDMKDVARAMESEEKSIVLKTIPTQDLLDEISRRCDLLETRDKAVRELYRIPEE
jgi:hypothetical protein